MLLTRKRVLASVCAAGLLSASLLAYALIPSTQYPDDSVQTLVFMRHAEKPSGGLGQLNCQGFNRAITLSHLLPERFGPAQHIFAANPGRKVEEGPADEAYNYVRPLMTIAPTAIRLGLPINLDYSANDVDDFVDELLEPKYRDKTIYTAWSRGYLPEVINEVLAHVDADDRLSVDKWHRQDYDSIFMLKLHWNNGQPSLTFLDGEQGLDGGSEECPGIFEG